MTLTKKDIIDILQFQIKGLKSMSLLPTKKIRDARAERILAFQILIDFINSDEVMFNDYLRFRAEDK